MAENHFTPEVARLLRTLEWSDPAFSLDKAYACCHLANLAYQNIPELEIQNNSRFKLVPSLSYQNNIENNDFTDIAQLLRSNDFNEIFTIYRRYSIITGIISGEVIFLAIRGTAAAFDWLINFNARRVKIGWPDEYYHRGFYKAIMAPMDEVKQEIRKRSGSKRITVIATGHSLGGAMAAVFRRFYTSPYISHLPSTYTFGMPRYGNMAAVGISSPYHIYNELDIVPRVPPLFFGYENCLNEYRLDGRFIENLPDRLLNSAVQWTIACLQAYPIRHHFMHVYLERMEKLINPEPQP